MEQFRSLLVWEDGSALWLAKATPRHWLEQGKKISVKNAPTYFGTVAYEIVSDVDHGKITATVEMPSPDAAKSVLLRLRHPKALRDQERHGERQSLEGFRPGKGSDFLARC